MITIDSILKEFDEMWFKEEKSGSLTYTYSEAISFDELKSFLTQALNSVVEEMMLEEEWRLTISPEWKYGYNAACQALTEKAKQIKGE